jgi:protein-L-isoaspartate(D-aspartate) O-methyltransferase
MLDLARQRRQMIDLQVAGRGIANPLVLEAMRRVPRERFVSPGLEEFAYEDSPLPIEVGQTISQPYIVAVMIDAAAVQAGHRVLEIGTGSGYQAAILSRIAADVITIERWPSLADAAGRLLASLGYSNVRVITGDGTRGFEEGAPYDGILVTAGAPSVPDALKTQLADGARLVIPVGPERHQDLFVVTRRGEEFDRVVKEPCVFVPLVGEFGWPR